MPTAMDSTNTVPATVTVTELCDGGAIIERVIARSGTSVLRTSHELQRLQSFRANWQEYSSVYEAEAAMVSCAEYWQSLAWRKLSVRLESGSWRGLSP